MSDPTKILIIFDLDFTLIDNSTAICNSFNYALRKSNKEPLERTIIIKKVGIPLLDMFLDYLDEGAAKGAVLSFREYYGKNFFEDVKIIPGVIDLLKNLNNIRYNLGGPNSLGDPHTFRSYAESPFRIAR